MLCAVRSTSDFLGRKRIAGALQSNRPFHAPGQRALYMLPATPEADELQQLPLELPRYLLVAMPSEVPVKFVFPKRIQNVLPAIPFGRCCCCGRLRAADDSAGAAALVAVADDRAGST